MIHRNSSLGTADEGGPEKGTAVATLHTVPSRDSIKSTCSSQQLPPRPPGIPRPHTNSNASATRETSTPGPKPPQNQNSALSALQHGEQAQAQVNMNLQRLPLGVLPIFAPWLCEHWWLPQPQEWSVPS